MRLVGCAEPRERRDLCVADRRHCRDAGSGRLTIQMHGASAALRQATAKMRIIEPEFVAKGIEQRHIRIGVNGVGLAVHIEGEFLDHGVQLPEQNKGAAAYGGSSLEGASFCPTLAGQRLVPQTALGNARAGKIDVKIAGTRPEQRPRETQGGTSQCAVLWHGASLLAQLLSPLSVPF